MVDIHYVYTKARREFGKPCNFSEKPAEVLVDILPDRALRSECILISPQDKEIQNTPMYSEHELNSERIYTDSHSFNHAEGGWPKDINPAETDHTSRFRKKMEKDDNYIFSVLNLAHSMEHYIRQNNAVDIYEEYFSDIVQEELENPPSARSLNVFRDPSPVKRCVTRISWNYENSQKIAVCYANTTFQGANWSDNTDSYIWDIDTPQRPDMFLKPKSHLMALEYNPKDSHVLLGGCYSGQVAFFDDRKGSNPVDTTNQEVSHTDPAHCVLWLLSKTGTEFFSSGTDGKVKWWDTRKLGEPLEQLILDVTRKNEIQSAHGATCMEFEPSMATKFMVGTEQGTVIVGNRKGKTPAEKIANVYNAHSGPIYALQRNPISLKNYLTVGDYVAKIWSEDVKESAVIWSRPSHVYLTNACWNPARPSVFFVTTAAGTVETWDILVKQKSPVLTIQISDESLESIRVQDHGSLLAAGSSDGNTTLVEVSEVLSTSQKNDRAVLTQMFEREVRREKTLEGRYREIRLKKAAGARAVMGDGGGEEGPSEADIVAKVRKAFFDNVTAFSAGEMRKRQSKRLTEVQAYEKELHP